MSFLMVEFRLLPTQQTLFMDTKLMSGTREKRDQSRSMKKRMECTQVRDQTDLFQTTNTSHTQDKNIDQSVLFI